MIKLKSLIKEGSKPKAGDYVRDKHTKELGKVNKIRGNKIAYVKFPSNKKSFLPMDVSKWKPSGNHNVGRTIWTEGILTEGKISSDIEKIAKKFDIKFKKKTKKVYTNAFMKPTQGFDMKGEDVTYDDWMDYDSPEDLDIEKFLKEIGKKYKEIDRLSTRSGPHVTFMNRKKDPKTKFIISIGNGMFPAGYFVSYEGVKGQ